MGALLFLVAGTLGVSTTIATSVVSIVLTGSTIITIILALTTILSAGADAILTMGWTAFVTTIKTIAQKQGIKYAVAW